VFVAFRTVKTTAVISARSEVITRSNHQYLRSDKSGHRVVEWTGNNVYSYLKAMRFTETYLGIY